MVAQAVKKISLHYVAVTSVTRDDLSDAGASQFGRIIRAFRAINPKMKIEVFSPDSGGKPSSLKAVLQGVPVLLSHNIETVSRLYPGAQPQVSYERSLDAINWSEGF
jgi:lipoic acid synthetase